MPKPTASPPPPTPPEKPLPTDCCGSGCAVCIYDAYADALEAYDKKLADWNLAGGSQKTAG